MKIRHELRYIETAKKYMFAEDLISCFLYQNGLPHDFPKVVTTRYRHLVPNAFSDVMHITVSYLYCRISVYNTFQSFLMNKMISIGSFIIFVQHLEDRYFSNGHNPQKFLYFCSHLAYMVVCFCGRGHASISKIAVTSIVRLMKASNIPDDVFWNGLSVAAFRYLKIAIECSFITFNVVDALRIQFVVKVLAKEQDLNDDGTSVDDTSVPKNKSDLSNLSNELIMKVSTIEDASNKILNNQNKTKMEKLLEYYNEILSRELFADTLSTGSESSELGEEKWRYENISEVEKSDLTMESQSDREISPEIDINATTVFNNLLNRKKIKDFSKSQERLVYSKMQQNLRKLKIGAINISDYSRTESEVKNKSIEIKSKLPSSLSETCGKKISPSITVKLDESKSSSGSAAKLPHSISKEKSIYSDAGEECAAEVKHTPEEFENVEKFKKKTYIMKSVNFNVCDKFVSEMVIPRTDKELYGETLESFIRKEDWFNASFSILTVAHYMATNLSSEILEIEILD